MVVKVLYIKLNLCFEDSNTSLFVGIFIKVISNIYCMALNEQKLYTHFINFEIYDITQITCFIKLCIFKQIRHATTTML